MARELCTTKREFEDLEGAEGFYPIQTEEIFEGDEIVVFDSSQVLPRYVVHYTVSLFTRIAYSKEWLFFFFFLSLRNNQCYQMPDTIKAKHSFM